MNSALPLLAELKKNRRSKITWVTFIAFSLAPLMGSIFFLILKSPKALSHAGMFKAKASLMSFSYDLNSYFSVLSQAVGVGGVLVFGFVASWTFGREYSQGTTKDLLALPTSRTTILNAKFISYLLWCFALAISNLVIGFIIVLCLQLPGWDTHVIVENLKVYSITTILAVMIGAPIAFFALIGEGYLAPLGFVVLTLVLAQIIAATGYGYYFPWAVPGLYSIGGEHREHLSPLSYALVSLTAILGYFATIFWWKYSDQSN